MNTISKKEIAKLNIRSMNLFELFDAFMLVWPVLILYYIEVGGTATKAGVLLSVLSMSYALFEIPIGVFSDKYGRARTTQLGSVCGVIAMSAIALSWWLGYWLLLIAVIIEGMSLASHSGNNEALIHDSSEVLGEEFFDNFANLLKYASYSAGLAMIVGGILADTSYPLVAGLSVLPRLLGLYYSTKLRDVRPLHEDKYIQVLRKGFSEIKKSKPLSLYTIGYTVRRTFSEAAWQYRAVFLQTVWPLWAIGLSGAIDNLVDGWSASRAKQITNKIGGQRKAIVRGPIYDRLISTFGVLMSNVLSPVVMGLGSIFGSAGNLSLRAQKHKHLPAAERATIDSIISFIATIIYSVSVIFLGSLFDKYEASHVLAGLTLMVLLSLPFYHFAFRFDED